MSKRGAGFGAFGALVGCAVAMTVFAQTVVAVRGSSTMASAGTTKVAPENGGPEKGAQASSVPPGVVIDHSPQSTGIYIASPSIEILPSGTYIASHDTFGPNADSKPFVMESVFESNDRGATWRKISEVGPAVWGTLFQHRGALYFFAPVASPGDMAIHRSNDGGHTWSAPAIIGHGRFGTSSMPFVEAGGRIWRATETCLSDAESKKIGWGGFQTVMWSAPSDADLMKPQSWTVSSPAACPTAEEVGLKWNTWLEGNAVVAPDGGVKTMLRCDYRGVGDERAAIVDVSADGRLTVDPQTAFIPFPGGLKKFCVRFDASTGYYWSLVNFVPQRHWLYNPERARNTSVLARSRDLRNWEMRCAVLYAPDIQTSGFQYADFKFDGDDIAAIYRTAYPDGQGGAHSQHDSNFITFKRIDHFRALTPDDSVTPWLAEELKEWNARSTQYKAVPGIVVSHLSPKAGIYVGSPSILRLPGGAYLMKHDEFGDRSAQDGSGVTRVFRSNDRGLHWDAVAKIDGLFWSTLFQRDGVVYQIGTSKQYGQLVVVRSTDGGVTWSRPTDEHNGLIRTGRWHTAPVPIVEANGRYWRAVEDCDGPDGWGTMFRPRMMSIPVSADLLDASQWTISTPIERDGKWLGGTWKFALEGNAVVGPDGRVRDVLRTDHDDAAGVLVASADGASLAPDTALPALSFGGTNKKFEIRWDPTSKLYWSLTNPVRTEDLGPDNGGTRNTLALNSSPDLKKWTTRCILLHRADPKKYAFQYPAFEIEGNDLLVACRTAYDDGEGGVPRGHDANFLTFHRFVNFRDLNPGDGMVLPEPPRPTDSSVELRVGAVNIVGRGIRLAKLANGAKAFINRDYAWANVPPLLLDAAVTQGAGGFAGAITLTATQPTTAYLITSAPTPPMNLARLRRVPAEGFHYTDRGTTPLFVFELRLAPGEPFVVPQGTWTGTQVAVPVK